MKNIIYLLPVLLFLFASCQKHQKIEKDVQNYFPKVNTLSADIQPDGTVIVTGQVLSQGNNTLTFAGFCMDTIPNPHMISNQVLVDHLEGDKFTYTFSSLKPFTKYYFRAWVANDNGYAIGEDAYIEKIFFDTSFIPCHPLAQKMVLTGSSSITESYTLISNLTPSVNGYEFHAMTGSHNMDVEFSKIPSGGTYTITEADYPDETSVLVSVDAIRSVGNGKLYVLPVDAHKIDVIICSVNVTAYSWISLYPFVLSTRLRVVID